MGMNIPLHQSLGHSLHLHILSHSFHSKVTPSSPEDFHSSIGVSSIPGAECCLYLFSCYIWLSIMFMGSCPLMALWFLIKLVEVLRPSLHDGFRFRQCVSIFVVDDFGLRRPLSSDFFNHFANFLWVLVRLFQMLTPLFDIISLVCICRLPKLLVEPCPSLQVASALSRAPLSRKLKNEINSFCVQFHQLFVKEEVFPIFLLRTATSSFNRVCLIHNSSCQNRIYMLTLLRFMTLCGVLL